MQKARFYAHGLTNSAGFTATVMDREAARVVAEVITPIWAEVISTALNQRETEFTVRREDVHAAVRVLNRRSSSLGDYREALKALVGWAE
jgi:hypothetical protein